MTLAPRDIQRHSNCIPPHYHRLSPAEGGITVNINRIDFDDQWVVPYKLVLSCTFVAHINDELFNYEKWI